MRVSLVGYFCVLAWFITAPAHAHERALWVWGMADAIVLDAGGHDRDDFYSFLAAPHGDPEARISRIYMCLPPSLIAGCPDRIRDFIADAHSRGLKVEQLTGDPLWALTATNPATGQPYNQPATDELETVLAYNRSVPVHERFDGIQYDVEPYLLTHEKGSPYEWGNPSDLPIIWTQYIDSLTLWMNRVREHNAEEKAAFILGAAIPRWWDPGIGDVADHRPVQDLVDYIAVMNYNTRVGGAVGDLLSELEYAEDPNGDGDRSDARTNSVYSGIESIDITWKEDCECSCETMYMHTASFFKKGLTALEEQVDELETAYLNTNRPQDFYHSMAGVALHYYEDIANGEVAYRNLSMGVPRNHAPAVRLLHPAGGEFLQGTESMVYTAIDSDGDALTVTVSISGDSGQSWTDLPALDADGNPMDENDGLYRLDTAPLPIGTGYLVRVTATENRENGITGLDRSDSAFSVVAEKTDDQPPSTAGVEIVSDSAIAHPVGKVLIQWTPFEDEGVGVAGYYYSLGNSRQSGERALHPQFVRIPPCRPGRRPNRAGLGGRPGAGMSRRPSPHHPAMRRPG
jgi:hypothetical protein